MKNLFIILAFICSSLLTNAAYAQRQESAQIIALRNEFLTRQLSLTPQEAEKFWPIYNEYQVELTKVFRERHRLRQEMKSGEKTPENELKFESDILELRKRYQKEFSKVLPDQKALMVYPAEREFREKLINQLQQRRQHPEK